MRNHRIALVLFILISGCFLNGCRSTQEQHSLSYNQQKRQRLVQRNFPLITWIQHHPAVLKLIRKDVKLAELRKRQDDGILKALKASPDSITGIIRNRLVLGRTQIDDVGDALVGLYNRDPKLMKSMVQALRQSHHYVLWGGDADTALLRAAWNNVAEGISYIQRTYLLGGKPTYGKIDGMTIQPDADTINTRLKDSLQAWLNNAGQFSFYQLRLNLALLALDLNERDEAARYLPITGGMNATAFAKVKEVSFIDYAYSCILVPGLGPEIPGERLTSGGKQRCKMAIAAFKRGVAPFLLVSGGHVHPMKTPFCEAVEMKKFMVDSLGIPDSCVIIDPHARHTTTNLRNAARIIQDLGMPFDKPVLIITDAAQSKYINQGMKKVALRDLGYLPYTQLKRLTETTTSFIPNIQSMQVNPLDPLDP